VVYELFNSGTAFELAKDREGDMEAWVKCVCEALEPDIKHMTGTDQSKILAILAREQARIDGTGRSAELFDRLISHI
jgi:hypothetical protein